MHSMLGLRHIRVPYIVTYLFSLLFNILSPTIPLSTAECLNEDLLHHNVAIPEAVLTPRGTVWELLLKKGTEHFIAKSDINPNVPSTNFTKGEEGCRNVL